MLFYTSLFIASLIVALVILWLYNALRDVGRTVYQAMLPSSRQNLAKEIQNVGYHTAFNSTPTPWGWEHNQITEKPTHSHAATSPKSTLKNQPR